MIKLYTLDCPNCKVLEFKLKKKNIEYETVKDIEIMKQKGIQSVPVLEIDGELLVFTEALKYVNER